MATCSTSSCRTAPITALTNMAAAFETAPGSRSKRSPTLLIGVCGAEPGRLQALALLPRLLDVQLQPGRDLLLRREQLGNRGNRLSAMSEAIADR